MSPEIASELRSDDALGQVLRDYLQVTQKLQHTHESLQREVVRLREELASKDRELERRRRLAALGELAAGVAHEVRNPLGAMQLYSDLLRKQCARIDGATALIDKLEAGIHAIDSVVQDTLALTPRGCNFERVRISEIIEQVSDFVAPRLAARQVSLRITPNHADPAIWADAGAIQRVLTNLIVNAADASPPQQSIELHVEHDEQQRALLLRVSDCGSGLPDELIDRIFDPFFTTKAHGTGLGLPIACRLLEAHHGRLSARNRPEGGAEFTVTLPIDPPPAAAAARQDAA